MPRAKGGAKTRHRRKKILKKAKGYVGGRRKLYRTAKETLIRAGVFAFRDRRARKRNFRKLWITRLNAACRERGLRYSEFIHGLAKAALGLNRKILSEMAIYDPEAFDAVFAEVQAAIAA